MSEYLYNFINDHCIVRAPPGYYIQGAKPGEEYTWQFYLRRAIFDQNSLFEIVKWLYQRHELNVEFQYAAMETAGPPMLSGLKLMGHFFENPIDGFAIRKEQKKYGLFNWTEGQVGKAPVVILDDLANSKSTIVRAASICQSMSLEIAGARTIVNKKDDSDVEGIPVESIFNISDFELSWWDYYDNKREEPNMEEYVKNPAFIKR